jgi:dihydrofolate synthase/folylpolyglutamate synthase
MNFQETLEYMYHQLPMYQRVGNTAFKKDLTNTIKLLEFLGNPHQQFKSIHIAGTNGKGSSAHMLASVLQTSGYRTGLYTSPHLKQFTERIKIDGMEVDEAFVCEFIEKLRNLIEDIRPSFFEITVAMAFDYFAREDVDIAIVEVGMGGRFDSTNVLLPIISLITSISYDHMEFLGHTLPDIAFEKAGIIKPGVPVVISETQGEIVSVFDEKAEQTKSPIYYADQEFKVMMNSSISSGSFDFSVETPGGQRIYVLILVETIKQGIFQGFSRRLNCYKIRDFQFLKIKLKKAFNVLVNTPESRVGGRSCQISL